MYCVNILEIEREREIKLIPFTVLFPTLLPRSFTTTCPLCVPFPFFGGIIWWSITATIWRYQRYTGVQFFYYFVSVHTHSRCSVIPPPAASVCSIMCQFLKVCARTNQSRTSGLPISFNSALLSYTSNNCRMPRSFYSPDFIRIILGIAMLIDAR